MYLHYEAIFYPQQQLFLAVRVIQNASIVSSLLASNHSFIVSPFPSSHSPDRRRLSPLAEWPRCLLRESLAGTTSPPSSSLRPPPPPAPTGRPTSSGGCTRQRRALSEWVVCPSLRRSARLCKESTGKNWKLGKIDYIRLLDSSLLEDLREELIS